MKDLNVLAHDSLEGRKTGTAGSIKAQKYIISRFESHKLNKFDNSYIQNHKAAGSKPISNIVGFINGVKYPDRYIVLSAHYDHLGIINGKVYNGADDNASGVSAMLAAIEYFNKNKPDHTIIFVALDSEESGLLGAKGFIEKPPIPIGQIILNINLDMVGRNQKNELFAAGTGYYPFLKPSLEKIKENGVKLKFGHDKSNTLNHDWLQSSDHYEFHKARIPFIYFGVEDHPDYHKDTDEVSKIKPAFFISAVRLIIRSMQVLDKDMANL